MFDCVIIEAGMRYCIILAAAFTVLDFKGTYIYIDFTWVCRY